MNIQQLVLVENNQPITSSRIIAEVFGKRHDHVIKAIEALEIPEDYRAPNFGVSEYEVKTGIGAMRKYKMYNLTKDGFTILAMGFTGQKAMEFKIKYINAFNAMAEELQKDQLKALENKEPQQKKDNSAIDRIYHAVNDVFGSAFEDRYITSKHLVPLIQRASDRLDIWDFVDAIQIATDRVFEPLSCIKYFEGVIRNKWRNNGVIAYH
ncbi:Rha family transcriptional regulator [Caedibacter taeniospiralis]|jgi:Rha family phage regulatory protein|uniref:Rha family transcriptional regulator n=1 Tax=Caedibacter taeniospiralis TaxID=28907 RepID=UPI0037BF593C